ncbi:Phosphoprotein phosphatase [Bertholletia excelsa]
MLDVQDFLWLWGFSIVSLVICFLLGFKESTLTIVRMASLHEIHSSPTRPPRTPSPPFPSSFPPPSSLISRFRCFLFERGGQAPIFHDDDVVRAGEDGDKTSLSSTSSQINNIMSIIPPVASTPDGHQNDHDHGDDDDQQNGLCSVTQFGRRSSESLEDMHVEDVDENEHVNDIGGEDGRIRSSSCRLMKRPPSLIIPESFPASEFRNNRSINLAAARDEKRKVLEAVGKDYYLACRKGTGRVVMEDGYGVLLDFLGDPKQAFFTVVDGHGGRAAADYVAQNLGKNIMKAIEVVGSSDKQDDLEAAIRGGYLTTDEEFLSQGANGGACAASVLVREGQVHVANVGDCRVVLSRKGVAQALTMDHCLIPIMKVKVFPLVLGGYLHCRNGVWRVNGTLAVSRAFGDLHMKELIISQPEVNKFPLNSDCEFLILASDGLWDKVNEQEAVDVVARWKDSIECCKKLIEMSSSRGNMDDITVMVINVQPYL